jgi:Fe-S-cluster containining protein
VKQSVKYDCLKCPGYCCSYPVIEVTERDIVRLARHFGIEPEEARKRYTHKAHGHERVLRRKPDVHYGRICRMFDTEARRCTVYKARPTACRAFPGEPRCGYYDFLKFERRHQDDVDFVATTDSGEFR